MRSVGVGDSGLEVSLVGLGCNNFGPMLATGVDEAGVQAVVDAALEAGITFFDTAEAYSGGLSEEYLGKALKGRRDGVVVATKFGGGSTPLDDPPKGSALYIREAIERSLRRLQSDYVDLYYYHHLDGVTPMEETLTALDQLVREGKVRWLGCSNVSASQLREADEIARTCGLRRFVAVQNEYSLLERGADDELLPLCRTIGVGLVPYFPLASGLLTGKYERGEPAPPGSRLSDRPSWISDMLAREEIHDRVDSLREFAESRGRTLLELAISAIAAQPGVSGVIAGAKTPTQVRANAAAADWALHEIDLAELPRFAHSGVVAR